MKRAGGCDGDGCQDGVPIKGFSIEGTAFSRRVRESLGSRWLCENRYANDIPPKDRRSSYRHSLPCPVDCVLHRPGSAHHASLAIRNQRVHRRQCGPIAKAFFTPGGLPIYSPQRGNMGIGITTFGSAVASFLVAGNEQKSIQPPPPLPGKHLVLSLPPPVTSIP